MTKQHIEGELYTLARELLEQPPTTWSQKELFLMRCGMYLAYFDIYKTTYKNLDTDLEDLYKEIRDGLPDIYGEGEEDECI